MKKSNVCDMTKGNVTKLLLQFAIPMLVGNIFQQLYNMVDSMIVGKYVGAEALGAVGAIGNIQFIFFSLCMGLSSGIGILVSQYFGATNYERMKKTMGNAITIMLVVGIVMSILGMILAKPVLIILRTPADTFAYAYDYMLIVCGATFVVAAYNGISAILRALGDSKTPLVFLVVACVINIGLDLYFVLGLHMGVKGAAWATVISQGIAAGGSIIFAVIKNPYFKLKQEHMMLDFEVVKECMSVGIPMAVQVVMISISCTMLQGIVNTYGSTVMAAYTATSRVEQLVQQPFNSLGVAMSTFAGQNKGAGQYDRVYLGCKKGATIVVGFSVLMILVMELFGGDIVSIFVDAPEIITIGHKGLRITSYMYMGLGMIYVMRGTLNGLGDAAYAMLNGGCEVLGRVVFAALFMMIPGVGFWGVWYTNGFTWVLVGAFGIIRFLKGNWKNPKKDSKSMKIKGINCLQPKKNML